MALLSHKTDEPVGDASLEKWELVGRGGFGRVYKARHKDWGVDVAIKTLHDGVCHFMPLQNEAIHMDRASFEFVVRRYGTYRGCPPEMTSTQQGLVMEFMENGSVDSLQKNLSGPQPWPLVCRLAHQVALGMNFLHSRNLVHHDLKLNNVLLNADLNAKLADFGLSGVSASVSINKDKMDGMKGSFKYMPPEAFDVSYEATRSFDIYSYGILLWSIINGKEPYPSAAFALVKEAIPSGQRPCCEEIDQMSKEGLKELVELMKRCWDGNPSKRPLFKNCLDVTENVFSKHKKGIRDAVGQVLTTLEQRSSKSSTSYQSNTMLARNVPHQPPEQLNDAVDNVLLTTTEQPPIRSVDMSAASCQMAAQFRHQLIDPVENLEGRMCTKHDKLLELFCKTDQMCVCMFCTVLDHKNHDVVPLKEEYEGKKAELGKTDDEIQQMIQKRRLKIQEIKHSVELSEEDADREIAGGVQVFTALKESVERSQAELIDTIKEKQRKTEKQAEGLIEELEQEICELKKRSTEVEQLSRSEDHLHLLQSFRTLKAAPPTKNWTGVRVRPPSYEGTVVRAVTQLEETLSNQMKKLLEVELKRVQQSAVDVTLDPETAHPDLILSDDGKQVKHGDVWKNLPDNPERFDFCVIVLAKQSFSSGRFYYEVQVKGKTRWVLGVVRESINRKGGITASPQKGFWTIKLRNQNEYSALDDPPVRLSLKSQPQKVGVFVDYEEGLVSFHDVDAAALIYSFTGCCFTEKLYPYFNPCLNDGGKNSAPLIISPVNHTE